MKSTKYKCPCCSAGIVKLSLKNLLWYWRNKGIKLTRYRCAHCGVFYPKRKIKEYFLYREWYDYGWKCKSVIQTDPLWCAYNYPEHNHECLKEKCPIINIKRKVVKK